MTNPLISKEITQGVVLELGAIVTLDHQYILTILTLLFIGEVFEGLLDLMLVFEEIDPYIS
jgi:hypothetical protein